MKRRYILLFVIGFFLCACKPETDRRIDAFQATSLENTQTEDPMKTMMQDTSANGSSNDETQTPISETVLSPRGTTKRDSHTAEEYVEMISYHRDKNLIAPLLLLNSADADQTNKEIEQIVHKMAGNGEKNGTVFMTYRALLNQEVLSVLIQMDEGTKIDFISYNFDIKTGKRLLADEVLAVAGINWKWVENIFYGERKAYWRKLREISQVSEEEYRKRLNQEISDLREFYDTETLPIILDEDGLANVICVLLDEDNERYWQLYCLSTNRTTLLQRNAYGSEFPVVVIEEPKQEEIADLKIVQKVTAMTGEEQVKTFLILPLWDDLEFLGLKSMNIKSREYRENKAPKSLFLAGGEGILMQIGSEEMSDDTLRAIIKQGDAEILFYPKAFRNISKEESGILYLGFE